MPTPTTPEEWLPLLTERLDADRARVRLLTRYMSGDAPLPEMSRNVKASWMKFQRRARTNWGELIISAVVDRIVPNGITVGGSADSPEAVAAQRIWRDNRMDAVFKSWLRLGVALRYSYLTCWTDDNTGRAIITPDGPDTMVHAENPLQPWKIRAAGRYWRDIDEECDYFMVWAPNAWQRFKRSIYVDPTVINRKMWVRASGGEWDADDAVPMTSDSPPVSVYFNPGGVGDYETHLDLINRINSGILQRLAISAMQAFKQRAIKGGPLPEKDAEGNDIDWTRVFEAAPGALWNLPVADMDIWESAATDIRPLLDESKDDIRQLSAVTRTPFSHLMPDNVNQSAQGAQNTEASLMFRAMERLTEAKVGAEGAMVKALEVEGITLSDDQTLELSFERVDMVTLAEKYQAAMNAKTAGESWRSISRNILGYSPEQIAQDALDRADELMAQMQMQQLMAQMFPPPAPPTPVASERVSQPALETNGQAVNGQG